MRLNSTDAHALAQNESHTAAGDSGAIIDIVIVNYNTRELLRQCLDSIAATCDLAPPFRTHVVDNGSSDGSVEMVRTEYPNVHLISLPENIGFGPANNRGVAAGNGDFLLFLNSDAQLAPGASDRLFANIMIDEKRIAVGPRLVYPDGRFQASCRRFPTPLRNFWSVSGLQARFPKRFRSLHNWLTEEEHQQATQVDMVSGACFMMRRSYLDAIGGFDEDIFLYEEEMDLFLPARRKGLEVHYCPEAVVIHRHGGSVSGGVSDLSRFHLYRSKYKCFRKHYGAFASWTTHLLDAAVFAASATIACLCRRRNDAAHKFSLCRRAYAASSVPIAELKRQRSVQDSDARAKG